MTLAKEATIKTNEQVGDGTTTTLVFLQSIYNEGIKYIEKGISPIILKDELKSSLNEVLKLLESVAKKPNKNDILNIVTTSSNSYEIGKNILDAYLKVKNTNFIKIKESNLNLTKVTYMKGYYFETNLATQYYFKDKSLIKINNPYILIFNTYLNNLNLVAETINYILKNKRELIIIAKDYSEELVNEIISLYLDNTIKIYLFKTPEYGINELIFLEDISLIANTNIIKNEEDINNIHVGRLESISFDKETTIINYRKTKDIKEKINNIKKLDNNDFNNKRIAMLSNSIALIEVGAPTTIERRELKMRYDDALCALSSAKDGVILGSGIPLLKISDLLSNKTIGFKILKESIVKPFEQIMLNANLDRNNILKYIKDMDYNIVYNINTNKYEEYINTSIIDSLNVIKTALINAVSIASMLLTTSSLVINEYNVIKQINDYDI